MGSRSPALRQAPPRRVRSPRPGRNPLGLTPGPRRPSPAATGFDSGRAQNRPGGDLQSPTCGLTSLLAEHTVRLITFLNLMASGRVIWRQVVRFSCRARYLGNTDCFSARWRLDIVIRVILLNSCHGHSKGSSYCLFLRLARHLVRRPILLLRSSTALGRWCSYQVNIRIAIRRV